MNDIDALFDELEGIKNIEQEVSPTLSLVPEPSPIPPDSISLQENVDDAISTELDIPKFVSKFNSDYNKINTDLDRDRAKIDNTISILFSRVENGQSKAAEVESLVKALQVLTDSNGHRVKLLESMGKILTAIRPSTTLIQNNVGTGDNDELKAILSSSETFDA